MFCKNCSNLNMWKILISISLISDQIDIPPAVTAIHWRITKRAIDYKSASVQEWKEK